MKNWIRTLSMLVCMALLMTMVPVDAYTEEVFVEAAEVQEGPAELQVEFEQPAEEAPQQDTVQEEEASVQEDSAPEDAASEAPEAETEGETVQEMSFLDVISELNAEGAAPEAEIELAGMPAVEAPAEVQPPFTLTELNMAAETELNLYEGGVLASHGADDTYVFSSTDELIAFVDANGILKAKFSGEVLIGVSVNGGEEALMKVVVKVITEPEQPEFTFTAEQYTIGVGMTTGLSSSIAGVRYASEGEAIQFNLSQSVTGVKPGVGTITATDESTGEVRTVTITVLPAPQPEQVSISATEMNLRPGESFSLDAEYAEGTMCDFAYESTDPDVAWVDDQGNVTAMAAGDAQIIVLDDHNAMSARLAVCNVHVEAAEAQSIAFTKTSLKIGRGDSFDLKELLEISPEGSTSELSFSSSKKSYASVTADGIVKGVKKGSANITVKTDNGLSAKIKVTVYNMPAAKHISFSPKSMVLGRGNSEAFSVKFSSGYYGLYTLESSDEDVILVENGRVTGLNIGSAEVILKLKSKPSVEKRMKVQVKEPPQQIEASRTELMMAVGQSSDKVFGVIPDPERSQCGFVYTTTNTDVIAVDEQTGKITAVGKGRGYVRIQADNNPAAYAECAVTVVELGANSLKLGVGDSCSLKQMISHPDGEGIGTYTFSTSNKKIATVNADGIVKGVKAGTANITIKSAEGLSVKVKVTVSKYATSGRMSISPAGLVLGEGMDGQLKVKFSSGYYGLYELTASGSDIIEVSADGTVHAKQPGEAIVVATLVKNPEISKTASIRVLPAPQGIQASVEALTLGVDQVSDDLYGINPDAGNSMCAFVYESSDTGIVRVDTVTGELTAISTGAADITIAAGNNPAAKAVCRVTVLDKPASLKLSKNSTSIGKGDTFDLKEWIEIPEGSAAEFSFSSSNKKYASVTRDGIVKGVKKGSANITVKTHNGLSAKIMVTVQNLATSGKMKVSPAVMTLGAGMEGRLKVSFSSGYNGLYEFVNDAEGIVRVDSNGNILALEPGEAVVTAQLKQKPGVKKTARITVLPAPEAIEASISELTLGVGQVSKALHGVNPSDGSTMCAFAYDSSDAGIVQVDAATGEMTAVGTGRARITVYAVNNDVARAYCDVLVLDAPKQVGLRENGMTVGVGNTFDLKEWIELPEGTAAGFTYSTSNKKYVSVTKDGIIKGVKKGTANITVKTHNNLSAKIKVTVKAAPGKIYLNPGELMLNPGMTADLKVSFASNSYFSLYSLASDRPEVASVQDGIVTAHKPGEATITAATQNGKTAKCQVFVFEPTTFVEFDSEAYRISEGMQLQTGLLVDEYSLDEFSYASDDDQTVAIDANGVITGLKPGRANISVRTANGIASSRICTVEVTAAPAELDFNDMPGLVIAKGHTIEMPRPFILDAEGNEVPANLSYTFTKKDYGDYAKISDSTLKGLKAGTVTVRVTSHNGKTADFTVKVVSDTIQRVELAHNAYTLYIGEGSADSLELNGSVKGASVNFGKPEYESDHPAVAVVSDDGVVTAIAPGSAVITATAYDGTSAACNITVKQLTGSVSFAEDEMAVTEGDTLQLQPVFDEGCGARLNYESSNMAVAVVDAESGLVTAMEPGTTEITVKTHNGLEARINLKVRALPEGIFFRVAGLNLVEGDDVLLKPVVQKAAALPEDIEVDDSASYVSSDETVASVAPDGTVTALKAGEAVITAETRNGLTASCVVTVLGKGSAVKTEFAWKTATMINGDTADLQFNLTAEAFERGFTIESADPEKLLVDERNWTITALGAAPEGVELTLTVNSDPDVVASVPQSVSCRVKIIEESGISFSAEQVSLKRSGEGSTASLEIYNLPEDLIGTFELLVEDATIAAYDVETGIVQAIDLAGETRIICRVFDCEISCIVKVGRSYRALIIGEYNNSSHISSNLPFAGTNVERMRNSLEMSYIDGETYDITMLSSNPSQAQIESAIASTFADAREGDVSLVYIVSHGYYDKEGVEEGGYCFGTPGWTADKPDSYITSDELLGWLCGIEGDVVLMLDSCRSGGFIRDTSADLENLGDIAVITAQVYNKNASYFVKKDGTSIEFLTYVLCAAIGYDYENNLYTGSLKADSDGDGEVTIAECFSYTKSQTRSLVNSKKEYFVPGSTTGFLVPGVKTNSQLKSWNAQAPQYYIPSAMEDVVLFAN